MTPLAVGVLRATLQLEFQSDDASFLAITQPSLFLDVSST